IQDRDTYAEVHTSQHLIHARYVFSSLPRAIPRDKNTHFLWQHFRGWFIRTSSPAFDASRMVLMDFRVPQQQATAFMYILPTSTREALMEYTVFSGELLASDKYDACIQDYLQTHYPGLNYVITEKEQGKIPMTDYAFPQQGERVIFIGTAGGQTKASTGYTFPFIQSHTDAIVQALEQNASPAVYHAPRERFYRYYDRLLLHVLSELQFPGDELFATLFGKNPTDMVIRFLSQQSSFLDDLSIILSLPKRPFLQAAIHEWKALIKQS
ncbi:MAG: lycopene cyclase, partial [Thermoflavifilum sp.]|nr:lycopene cyclase [Thermoflavifilum sp.]